MSNLEGSDPPVPSVGDRPGGAIGEFAANNFGAEFVIVRCLIPAGSGEVGSLSGDRSIFTTRACKVLSELFFESSGRECHM